MSFHVSSLDFKSSVPWPACADVAVASGSECESPGSLSGLAAAKKSARTWAYISLKDLNLMINLIIIYYLNDIYSFV